MDYTYDESYNEIKHAEMFYDLPNLIQSDLISWFNSKPNNEEKELLLTLYRQGNFKAWNCPECNERVYRGNPDIWDDFQGTCNQDFSYFGNPDKYRDGYINACCDYCRCHKLR